MSGHDIVLCDIGMPDASGWDVARAILSCVADDAGDHALYRALAARSDGRPLLLS